MTATLETPTSQMSTPVDDVRLRELVWDALGTVRDPELDQPITELTFVNEITIHDGDVAVTLRLPTYFCAPNFAYLMVADAHDAVVGLPGVRHTDIQLLDHFAAAEINAGVAERSGFSGSFPGEAFDDLETLRETFRRKAYLASLERACRVMLDKDWDVEELYLAQIFDMPLGSERTSLLNRRDELGMSCLPNAYLLMDENGFRIPQPQIRLKLRFAKTVRVSIEGNGTLCRGLLDVRYGTDTVPGTFSGVSRPDVPHLDIVAVTG